MSSLKRFVSASQVNDLVRKGFINNEGIRLLDCSYIVPHKPDPKLYKEELYGKFELLKEHPTPSIKLYLAGHIPGAVHMSLDAAVYPSNSKRFKQYEPHLFEKYVQLLGINKSEHVIFYSRGPLAGMMFAARCAWLFKSYGHEAVSILDGGWNQWFAAGYEVADGEFHLPKGDWTAEDHRERYTVDFEQLFEKDLNEKDLLERTDEINFLDSRSRGQFEGTEETGLDPHRVKGTHIPGFKNCPSAELLTPEGLIKSEAEIEKWLESNGYVKGRRVVTNCNTGMSASLLSYAIERIVGETPRLYGGSLKEMELRAPKKISGGLQHIHT